MIHIVVGIVIAVLYFVVMRRAATKGQTIKWWGKLLTAAWALYVGFVLEVIIGFVGEGSLQGALVMGMITAVPAIIWAVLLGRFVFVGGAEEAEAAVVAG